MKPHLSLPMEEISDGNNQISARSPHGKSIRKHGQVYYNIGSSDEISDPVSVLSARSANVKALIQKTERQIAKQGSPILNPESPKKMFSYSKDDIVQNDSIPQNVPKSPIIPIDARLPTHGQLSPTYFKHQKRLTHPSCFKLLDDENTDNTIGEQTCDSSVKLQRASSAPISLTTIEPHTVRKKTVSVNSTTECGSLSEPDTSRDKKTLLRDLRGQAQSSGSSERKTVLTTTTSLKPKDGTTTVETSPESDEEFPWLPIQITNYLPTPRSDYTGQLSSSYQTAHGSASLRTPRGSIRSDGTPIMPSSRFDYQTPRLSSSYQTPRITSSRLDTISSSEDASPVRSPNRYRNVYPVQQLSSLQNIYTQSSPSFPTEFHNIDDSEPSESKGLTPRPIELYDHPNTLHDHPTGHISEKVMGVSTYDSTYSRGKEVDTRSFENSPSIHCHTSVGRLSLLSSHDCGSAIHKTADDGDLDCIEEDAWAKFFDIGPSTTRSRDTNTSFQTVPYQNSIRTPKTNSARTTNTLQTNFSSNSINEDNSINALPCSSRKTDNSTVRSLHTDMNDIAEVILEESDLRLPMIEKMARSIARTRYMEQKLMRRFRIINNCFTTGGIESNNIEPSVY